MGEMCRSMGVSEFRSVGVTRFQVQSSGVRVLGIGVRGSEKKSKRQAQGMRNSVLGMSSGHTPCLSIMHTVRSEHTERTIGTTHGQAKFMRF